MISGKSPREIRDTFGLVDDLTQEEKREAIKQVAWCDVVFKDV